MNLFSAMTAPGGSRLLRLGGLAGAAALAIAAAGCGNGSSPSATTSKSTSTSGHKGGVFTILANSAFGVADPAQNYTLEEWQLLINTHDGLTGFQKVGGVPGTKIVPDLAKSWTVSADRKTYVFELVNNAKFTNGAAFTAADAVFSR